MNRRSRATYLWAAAIAAAVFVPPASADGKAVEWRQWMGPSRNATSLEKNWNPRKLQGRAPVLWRRLVGVGYSAVAVAGGRLFTMGYDEGAGTDIVFSFDAKTGKEHWRFTYECRKYDNMNAGGPASTPATDGERVYTFSREAHLHCLDAATGKVLWKYDLKATAGARVPSWGFSGSPLLHGDRVVVDAGPILGFDRNTGKRAWGTRNYGSAYSSPVPMKVGSRTYLVTFPAQGIVVLDADTGAEAAAFEWETPYGVNAATPVILNNFIFVSSGYNVGSALLAFLDGKRLRRVWSNGQMRNHMSTCVFWRGYLYGFDNSLLKCISVRTGRELWRRRGLGKGALSLASGYLLVQSERGDLWVVAASPEGFRPAARCSPYQGGPRNCWTLPTLAGGLVYCRSPQGELVCLDARK